MSADLYWPPRPWRAWLPELVFAGVFGLVFLPFALGLPLAALLESLLFAGVRTWRRLRSCGWSRYRRRPGSCRVAVIGAGWSGLAIAARLRELGVPFDGFEADDDVGGTWHPSRRYADLTMHAPAYGATFAGFPWPSPDERPTGEQVHAYMRSFAESKDLLRSYSFSTAVSGVDYCSYSRTATLTVNRRGGRGEEKEASAGEAQSAQQAEVGPFDLVIFASLAAQPAAQLARLILQRFVRPCELSLLVEQRLLLRLELIIINAHSAPILPCGVRQLLDTGMLRRNVEPETILASDSFEFMQNFLHFESALFFQIPIAIESETGGGADGFDDQLVARPVDPADVPPGTLHICHLKGRVLPVAAAKFLDDIITSLRAVYSDDVDQ